MKRSDILPWKYSLVNLSPEKSGLFILRNKNNSIIYIGNTTKKSGLKSTLISYYKKSIVPETKYFDWYELKDNKKISEIKNKWINNYLPKANFKIA